MPAQSTKSEPELAEELAFGFYLRTGNLLRVEVFLGEIQRKFNPYHDPDDGRFTFAPGSGGRASVSSAGRLRLSSYPVRNVIPEPKTGYPVRIELPKSNPVVKVPNKPMFRFEHSAGLDLPDEVVAQANALSDTLVKTTGHQIHVTSGRRDARRQATAMYNNYLQGKPPRYANVAAHAEVLRAFSRGRRNLHGRDAVIESMAIILANQMRRGIYLSRHMRSMAIDIRMPPANVVSAIRRHPSVQSVGVEDDHLHIQFR